MQTQWKVLLGLLGTAALVTIITVPAVLLSQGSKFVVFGDQDLLLFCHRKGVGGFVGGWGLCDRQVVAGASQVLLLLLGQQLDGLLQGFQR